MGVVHKLTEEVIDFIVKQKQLSPAIGCRRLSEVVADQFHIHVSKSSISSVLQEAKLSSPVGRRSLPNKKATMKFKIPDGKKKEIFSISKQETAGKSPQISSTEKKKPLEVPESKPIFRMRPVLVPAETAPIQNKSIKREMSNLKSPQAPFPQRIDMAGLIFLKVSQWDMAGGSLLGKVLKEEFSNSSKEDCDRVGDLAFCLEYFGITNFSTITNYKEKGLWVINGASSGLSGAMSKLYTSAQNISDFGMKASVEAGALLQRISSFKVTTDDGTLFYVDALQKIISLVNVQSEKGVPLTDAVRVASEDICGNAQPAVFQYFIQGEIDPALQGLITKLANAFNHLPGQSLKQVALCDENGTEVAKFSYGLAKKKNFILALWPSANLEIPQVSGTDGEVEILGQKFVFKTHPFTMDGVGSKNALVAMTVSRSSEKAPFVRLLTNCAVDLDSQKKALSHFLFSWPGLDLNSHAMNKTTVEQIKPRIALAADFLMNVGISASFEQGTVVLRQALNQWAQQYYFGVSEDFIDEKTMKERFYSLEGLWQEDEQSVAISFRIPLGYPYINVLKMAVDRVNQQMIRDTAGRRIILGMAPAV